MTHIKLSATAEQDLTRILQVFQAAGVKTRKITNALRSGDPALQMYLMEAWESLPEDSHKAIGQNFKRSLTQLINHISELILDPQAEYAEDRRREAVSEALSQPGRTSITKRINLPTHLVEQVEALTAKELGNLIEKALKGS